MPVDFVAMITSFDRPVRLMLLLEDLEREAKAAQVSLAVCVINDGSTLDYTTPAMWLIRRGYPYLRQPHEGKKRFWVTMTALWQAAKTIEARYYLNLQDDLRLIPGFFVEWLKRWHAITAPVIRCLEPLVDKQRLTYGKIHKEQHGPYTFDRMPWTDAIFTGDRLLMDTLEWQVSDPMWHRSGSGVGILVTRQILHAGGGMFRSDISLVHHGAHRSKMHEGREGMSDGGVFSDTPITAGMATWHSPERLASLPKVLTSLTHQVQRLHLWWNGGKREAPGWIRNNFPWVTVHEGEDLADMGKFARFDTPGYLLTLDDDFLYPPGFVATLLRHLEAYQRRAIVGYHGIRLRQWPVQQSYYRERLAWHHQKPLAQDTACHILGTGLCAWHTDLLPLDALYTHEPLTAGMYMADLWLAKAAQRYKLPMVCLAHTEPVVTPVPNVDNIFTRFYGTDARQTAYINSGETWVLHPLPPRIEGE